MANLSHLVAATFSILALLSSFICTTKLSCSLSTTFSSLSFLSKSLLSLRFNLLRVARHYFLWFSVFLCSRLILSLSFLYSSVSEAQFALSFSFLSEHCITYAHAQSQFWAVKTDLNNTGVTGPFLPPKTYFEHART